MVAAIFNANGFIRVAENIEKITTNETAQYTSNCFWINELEDDLSVHQCYGGIPSNRMPKDSIMFT